MLIRINFLLGFGFLVMLLFYFGFTYLIIKPVSAFAPDWAGIAAGAAILLSVGLTVQILSMAMSGLAGIATHPHGPDAMAIASQAAIVGGHGALGFAASTWFAGGVPPTDASLLLICALYAAGVAIAVIAWRQRNKAPLERT